MPQPALTLADVFGPGPYRRLVCRPDPAGPLLFLGHVHVAEADRWLAAAGWQCTTDPRTLRHTWAVFTTTSDPPSTVLTAAPEWCAVAAARDRAGAVAVTLATSIPQ